MWNVHCRSVPAHYSAIVSQEDHILHKISTLLDDGTRILAEANAVSLETRANKLQFAEFPWQNFITKWY